MTHVCARGHVVHPDEKGRCPRCGQPTLSLVAIAARRKAGGAR